MIQSKLLIGACTLFITAGLLVMPNSAKAVQPDITVHLDGLPVQFDVQPITQNYRTLVPFRAIAESMNIKVDWEESTKTVTASNGQKAIRLQIGNNTAYVNDSPVELDAAPVQYNYRTMIPARFFAESFDCKVNWDETNQRVLITTPPSPMTVTGFYALGDSSTSSWTDLFNSNYPTANAGHTKIVSDLGFGWYTLDHAGNLLTQSPTGWNKPDGWEDILSASSKYKLRSEMVIHMTNTNDSILSLLENESAMQNAAALIVKESALFGGVNLDLEGLGLNETGEELIAVQQKFTYFANQVKGKLQTEGKTLTLTLHPPNSWYKGYDYKSLGAVADRIIIMAYDYGGKPEPADKVVEAVKLARESVSPEKLVLGISAYNETPESIVVKVGIAKRYSLNGIALWRLGLLSDEMWQALYTSIQVRNIQ